MRPKPENRKFVSTVIEEKISEVKRSIADEDLADLFENCFPNTLDTTIDFKNDNEPYTFVITGDINAMWLRDSTAQVFPYLQFANEDLYLKEMIKGVINRQRKSILLDPYANAFLKEASTKSEWENDLTEMKPGVHERKWELDSLCYHIRLIYNFWKITGDASCLGNEWQHAGKLILKTFAEQLRKDDDGPYKFGRITGWSTDTVPGNGYGNPIEPVGLIASVFRPSDDATIFPFLVPSNYFAVISLKQMSEIFDKIYKSDEAVVQCKVLAYEIENSLLKYSVSDHLNFGKIFAYEVDGFGNKLFMDDANVPSLLSLPYLGCFEADDPVYRNTRKFILSKNNPYFFTGTAAEGTGSPHTLKNNIWHIGIIMRALTSTDDEEIIHCLYLLKTTNAGTGFMHESFDKDYANVFTRSWFAWANSLFGELILKLNYERSGLLKRKLAKDSNSI